MTISHANKFLSNLLLKIKKSTIPLVLLMKHFSVVLICSWHHFIYILTLNWHVQIEIKELCLYELRELRVKFFSKVPLMNFFLIFKNVFIFQFFKDFIYLFLERGRERERGGEKHEYVVASRAPPTGNLACNPGMCPDWEWNWRPFGSQVRAQSTEPHQPGRL